MSDGNRPTSRGADLTVAAAWASLPIQFFGGGAILGVTLWITTLFSAGDSYDGGLTLIGSGISGAIVSAFFMVPAFLIGLPLRLNRRLRHWWVVRGMYLMLGCAVVGVIGIVLSYIGPWASDVPVPEEAGLPSDGIYRDPHRGMYLASLVVASFGLCNFMPPVVRFAPIREKGPSDDSAAHR